MGRPATLRIGACWAATAAAILALASGAAAQPPVSQNPLGPLQPQPTAPTAPQPTIATPTTTTASAGGLSGGDAAAIGIGALVLLTGISFFIWRDARRRAPLRGGAAAAAAGGGYGTRPKPKPRKLSPAERRRRKRGKAR